MSEPHRNEKGEEKQREKDDEKRGGVEEKWRRDRVSALVWGAVVIWGGLVLLAETTGLTDRYRWWQSWAVFLAGWGVIILIGVLIRLLMPENRRPVGGSVILGIILLAVGLGDLLGDWNYIWPAALIIIGLIILVRALTRNR